MHRIAAAIAAFLLIAHGVIHLMGTAIYACRAEIQGLSYKTTLFSGRLGYGRERHAYVRFVMDTTGGRVRRLRRGDTHGVGLVEAAQDRCNPNFISADDSRLERCL